MNNCEIIIELATRGERDIKFPGNGLIRSTHGKDITTHWIVINGAIVCVNENDKRVKETMNKGTMSF